MADTFSTEFQSRINPTEEATIQATVDAEAELIANFNDSLAALAVELAEVQAEDQIHKDYQEAALAAFETQLAVILADLDANPPGGFTPPFSLVKGGNFPVAGENNPATTQNDFSDFEFEDSGLPTPDTIDGADYLTGGPEEDAILVANEARWAAALLSFRGHYLWGSLKRIQWIGAGIANTTAQRDLLQAVIDAWKVEYPPTP